VEVKSELCVPYLEVTGFYDRRDLGFGGTFFGPEYLTQWPGHWLPTILDRVGGIDVRRLPGGRYVVVNRRGGCATMTFIIDGLPARGMESDLTVPDVAAIEVYRGPSEAVGTLHPVDPCGLVLVWTWHEPDPFLTEK
jgi:hypothetical protein